MNIYGTSHFESNKSNGDHFSKLKFEKITFNLIETKFTFDEVKGVFKLEDTKKLNIKKKEIDEIEKKLKEKNEKMYEYNEKIKKLNLKLKNMEKVLLLDDKEQQYIHLLGKNQ